jgi:CDP-diglyceride synthetase
VTENKEEKHVPDPWSRVTGGLILILLGILFLLVTMDILSWGIWWAYFLCGLGVIFILEAVLRSGSPEFRQHLTGRLIAGVILMFIGGSFIFGVTNWWPFILIGVGVALVISTLWTQKKPKE